MQTHIVQLTKRRLSDFFVREEGHVAHKNALAAGTVATSAVLASLMLTPEIATADDHDFECGDPGNFVLCDKDEYCCSGFHDNGDVYYFCADKRDGCPPVG